MHHNDKTEFLVYYNILQGLVYVFLVTSYYELVILGIIIYKKKKKKKKKPTSTTRKEQFKAEETIKFHLFMAT